MTSKFDIYKSKKFPRFFLGNFIFISCCVALFSSIMKLDFLGVKGLFIQSVIPIFVTVTLVFRYLHIKNSLWRNAFRLYVAMLYFLASLAISSSICLGFDYDFWGIVNLVFVYVIIGQVFALPFWFAMLVFNSLFSGVIYRD